MALPTGTRPRTETEYLALGNLIQKAPSTVSLIGPDDGWLAASLRIAGREVRWGGKADASRVRRLLERWGLGPLPEGGSTALVHPDLRLEDPGVSEKDPPPVRLQPPPDGPLVTILICTYNRASLLRQSLASAQALTWPHEIVVVNDGSTDGTRALLDSTDGIRAFHQLNTGKPGALERGLAEARGEFLLVLDDDDLLLPGALHVLARALHENPELSAVYGDTLVFADAPGTRPAWVPAERLPGVMSRRVSLNQIPAMPGATLIRMAAQREAGAYDPRLVRGQDMDMYMRLSRVGPMEALPFVTFLYRSHDALRGSAVGQWLKSAPGEQKRRFLTFVQPVFRERWRAEAPSCNRDLGHDWALGLHLRDLDEEARAELDRWPPPWTPREAWIRAQVGLKGSGEVGPEALVVVDDGDPGALEAVLHAHAADRALWVDLEVPRDPLGNVRVWWPGEYGAREVISRWVRHEGPWACRLTSAPTWAPPILHERTWVPPLPSVDALLATAAALGWPEPVVDRPGRSTSPGPEATAAVLARRALREGTPSHAIRPVMNVLVPRLPSWAGTWRLAADAFEAAGKVSEAAHCRERLDRCIETPGM